MPSRFHAFSLALAAVLAQATLSTADPLKPQWVAADAQWVAHVDVDAMMQATLVKHVLADPERFHIKMDGIEEVKQHLGVDPLKDVHGFTAYGSGDPHHGNFVFIVTVDAVIDRTVEKVKTDTPEYREISSEGLTLHSFKTDHGPVYFSVRGVGGGESVDRVVVMSHDLNRLVTGLEVIDGKGPGLDLKKAGDDFNRVTPSDGSVLYIAASGLDWIEADDDAASALLRTSEQFTIDIGEEGEDSYVDASMLVGSTEDAINVVDVLRGLKGLGRMMAGQEPDMAALGDLFNGITINSNGNRVQVSVRQPTARLVNALEHAAALHGEHHDDDDDDEVNVKIESRHRHSSKIHEH